MIYADIQNALMTAGIDVRSPAAKQGVCTSPYVVAQDMGTYRYAQSNRLVYTLISVHCYVPLVNYDELSVLVQQVETALEELAPDLRPTGSRGIHTINDKFRAHETYLEYMVQKRAN